MMNDRNKSSLSSVFAGTRDNHQQHVTFRQQHVTISFQFIGGRTVFVTTSMAFCARDGFGQRANKSGWFSLASLKASFIWEVRALIVTGE
jgi:hypothetical protein